MPDVFDQAETKTVGDVFDQATAHPKAKYATGGGPGKFHNPTEEEKKQGKSDIENRPENTGFGLGRAVTGIEELTGSTRQQNLKRGAHNLIVGGGEMALPLAGEAIVAAPLRAAGAAAGSYAGSKIGHGAARLAGASEDAANLVGDATGAAGAVEGASGFKATRYLAGGLKSLTPEWISKFHAAGKSTAGKISPKAAAELPEPKTPKPGKSPSRYGKDDAVSPPPPTPPPSAPPGPSPSRLAKNDAVAPQPKPIPPPVPGMSPSRFAKNDTAAPPGPAYKPVASPSQHAKNWRSGGSTSVTPQTAIPGTPAPVDAPTVDEAAKGAAELMKAVGITPEEAPKATPEQWKMIEQQVGSSFDHQQAIERLKSIGKEAPKPSPKADLPSGPKTAKPSPGGAKVESTVTPEARATRADEHAAKLAQTIRKTLAADKIPESGNDAAWKVLEDQTGTEATPAVRNAAIEKARKLWSEGPRSAGDLQKRRADYFAKTKAPASSSE